MISKQVLQDSRLLIIDDNQANVELLEKMLSAEGYSSIVSITDPRKAEKIYVSYQPHLVLLDINMPYLDGFQVMEQFRTIEQNSYIPVLVLTALQDNKTRIHALSKGAQDFLTKPFDKIETLTRIENMLKIRHLHNQVKDQNLILERKVQERTIALEARTVELQETRMEIISRLGQAAEYRDPETGDHILRISKMCKLLASKTGMNEKKIELLSNASPMHDVGKIGIPDSILLKPGKLTREEWKVMQTHTIIGARLLDNHNSELMIMARDIALNHHEKWDGSGYPNGMKGINIPIEGRITGIVDVFDALTSKRPYKDPYPVKKACEIIKMERGYHFDPELTDLLLTHIDEFTQIKKCFSDETDLSVKDLKLSERDKSVV